MKTLKPDCGINIANSWYPDHLLSGWKYAIDSLWHAQTDAGIYFDGFLDKRLSFGSDPGDCRNLFTPHKVPWVGVLHNPPTRPSGFSFGHSAGDLISSEKWRSMSSNCCGILTLSEHLANWLRPLVQLPVRAVIHPFPLASMTFSPECLRSGRVRRLFHIGSWLRNYKSFALVSAPNYEKFMTDPVHEWNVYEIDRQLQGPERLDTIIRLPHLNVDSYKGFICSSVAFLDLLDASACNAVLDCLAHHTPLVVRSHPAVEEYLGEAYPLFYDSLDEAACLLQNTKKLLEAHAYLRERSQLGCFRGSAFSESVLTATIMWNSCR